MNLPSVDSVPQSSTVILRLDLDLPLSEGQILDNSRLQKSLPTINLLLDRSCQLIIIGHLGRPQGIDPSLSLKPIYLELISLLVNRNPMSIFLDDFSNLDLVKSVLSQNQIIFFENLRFWPDEDANNSAFLETLISQSQFFVNDAIAVAHRSSTSITLHRRLPTFYGLNFIDEFTNLQKITSSPHPLTIILGGAKADKLSYIPELLKKADHILIGGKLPQLNPPTDPKIFTANLTADTFDIDDSSIAKFKEIIFQSRTIIWSGALGFYENPVYRHGTIEIANTLANSSADFKVIAGGDTSASIKDQNLSDKIDFICSGGGVLLAYLAHGTLPALE